MYQHLGYHFATGNEVGERHEGGFDEMLHDVVAEFHTVGSVAHHLWSARKRAFEGGGAGGDQCGFGIFHKLEGGSGD